MFRFERISATEVRRLCPPCDDEREADNSRTRYASMLIIGVGALLFFPDSWLILVVCFAFSVGFLLMTPLHELAHAGMAKLVGLSVDEISIGTHGRPMKTMHWGRCRITIRRGLDGGHMSAMSASMNWIRLRYWLVTAAGPSIHIVAVVFLWPEMDLNDRHLWWQLGIYFAFFTNAVMLWSSLVPFREVNWNAGRYNDAMLLLWFPLAKRANMEAYHSHYFVNEANYRLGRREVADMRRVLVEGLRHYPEDPILQSMSATAAILEGEATAGQTIYRRLHALHGDNPDIVAYTRMHLAWSELIHYPLLDRTLSSNLTQASMDELPWIPLFQGLHGCALIANGNEVEGVPLVIRAREEACWFELALYETYLALASVQRQEWDDARTLLDRAAELHPQLVAIAGVRGALSNACP